MPDEEQKQPPQRPTRRELERRDFSQLDNSASDGETLKASGARPSPTPDSDPKNPGPINKAADLTGATDQESERRDFSQLGNAASDGETLKASGARPSPKPPPSPASDSDEG